MRRLLGKVVKSLLGGLEKLTDMQALNQGVVNLKTDGHVEAVVFRNDFSPTDPWNAIVGMGQRVVE